MARAQKIAECRTASKAPSSYGFRNGPKGGTIPLKENDLLHPQPGDFHVHNSAHNDAVGDLWDVLRCRIANKTTCWVYFKHIIDFEQGNIQPLVPDLTIVTGKNLTGDAGREVYRVRQMKSQVFAVIEVTCPTTRKLDLHEKFDLFYRADVPLYIICDAKYGGSRKPRGILAYRAGLNNYEEVPLDASGRFWIEPVRTSIGIIDGRVRCFNENGDLVPTYLELARQSRELEVQIARRKLEANRYAIQAARYADEAESYSVLTDQQVNEAENQAARANAAEKRIRELEAQIKKSKRPKK